MHPYLHVATGPYSGRKLALRRERPIVIGRDEEADYAFFSDTYMSRLHARAELAGSCCQITDLESRNGVFIDEQRITHRAELQSEQRLKIGETYFVLGQSPVPVEELIRAPLLEGRQAQFLADLMAGEGRLYAILDAAQSDRICSLLRDAHLHYQSLYEGEKAQELVEVAPYLVLLADKSPLTPALIREGWDKNWGVYLRCDLNFTALRRHLRRFLTVETEEGKKLFFRLYDPRVLEVFLPTCDASQRGEFFGPIKVFYTQAEGSWVRHEQKGEERPAAVQTSVPQAR